MDRTPPPEIDGPRLAAARRLTLRIAVAAVLFGVIPVCPPAGLAGAFLGLYALMRCRRGFGSARTERLAAIAVLVGAVTAAFNTMVIERGLESAREELRIAVAEQVERLFDDDASGWPDRSADAWSTKAAVRPDAAALRSFVTGLEPSLGELEGVTILSEGSRNGFSESRETVAVNFEFADGSRLGSVVFDHGDVLGIPTGPVRLVEVRVELDAGAERMLGGAGGETDEADSG